MTTDSLIHTPSLVDIPLPKGSFVDGLSGLYVTRVSDKPYQVEYSTKSPFNADNSKFLALLHDHFVLIDTQTLDILEDFGRRVAASSEPLWHRTDPNSFYYHPPQFNQLMQYNNGQHINIRKFTEYSTIYAGGESEISWDGDHLVLSGNDSKVFLYTISQDVKSPTMDTGSAWDSLYVSPDNNVLIAWNTNGTGRYQGEELYDKNLNFIRQVSNNNGHKCVTRDTDGKEVLVKTNSAELFNASNKHKIVKYPLDGFKPTDLLELPWETSVLHVSAPKDKPFVVVSTTHNHERFPNWGPFYDEIIKVNLDGSGFKRLVHTRSKNESYEAQPHASVSRDGTKLLKILFNSSWTGQVEVYMLDVPISMFDFNLYSWYQKMISIARRARFPWWPI